MSNSYHERLERAVLQLLEYAYVDALMGSEDAKAVALYATLRALDGDEKCARCGSLGTTVLCESVRMCADCEDAIREHYAPTPPPEPQPADFTDGPWSDPPEMPPLPRWHREASTEELLKWRRESVEAATAGLLAEIDDRVRLAKGLLAAKERAEARIAELGREAEANAENCRKNYAAGEAAERERVLLWVLNEIDCRVEHGGSADIRPLLTAKLRGEGGDE